MRWTRYTQTYISSYDDESIIVLNYDEDSCTSLDARNRERFCTYFSSTTYAYSPRAFLNRAKTFSHLSSSRIPSSKTPTFRVKYKEYHISLVRTLHCRDSINCGAQYHERYLKKEKIIHKSTGSLCSNWTRSYLNTEIAPISLFYPLLRSYLFDYLSLLLNENYIIVNHESIILLFSQNDRKFTLPRREHSSSTWIFAIQVNATRNRDDQICRIM